MVRDLIVGLAAYAGGILAMLLAVVVCYWAIKHVDRDYYDSAPAPEAAPISDPSEPPEPAPPGELGEGVFEWVPGHWEEIEPFRPVAERDDLVRLLQTLVDAEGVDPGFRDQLIADLFRGKIDSREGWKRLNRARNPEPPKADDRPVIAIPMNIDPNALEIEVHGEKFRRDSPTEPFYRVKPPKPDEREAEPVAKRILQNPAAIY